MLLHAQRLDQIYRVLSYGLSGELIFDSFSWRGFVSEDVASLVDLTGLSLLNSRGFEGHHRHSLLLANHAVDFITMGDVTYTVWVTLNTIYSTIDTMAEISRHLVALRTVFAFLLNGLLLVVGDD